MDYISFFTTNSSYFEQNNIFSTGFRHIGWLLVKLLKTLADVAQLLLDKVYSFLDIMSWAPFVDFLNSFKVLHVSIIAISLMAIGLTLMFTTKKMEINPIISILLFAMVTVGGSTIIGVLNESLLGGKDAIEGEETIASNVIIKNNIYDLIYIDQQVGLENMNGNPPTYSSFTDKDFDFVDPAEVMNPSSSHIKAAGQGILSKVLTAVPNGASIADIYNGFGWNSQDDADFGNEFYYRYTINFGQIFLRLLAIILIYICSTYKTGQFIYNIFSSEIMGMVFSAEISNPTKIKKILLGIRDTYIGILCVMLNIRIFLFVQQYINETFTDEPLVQAIFILMLAVISMDGPNVFEIVTGRDCGMKSALGLVAGGAFAANMGMNKLKSMINNGVKLGKAGYNAFQSKADFKNSGIASGTGDGNNTSNNQKNNAMSDASNKTDNKSATGDNKMMDMSQNSNQDSMNVVEDSKVKNNENHATEATSQDKMEGFKDAQADKMGDMNKANDGQAKNMMPDFSAKEKNSNVPNNKAAASGKSPVAANGNSSVDKLSGTKISDNSVASKAPDKNNKMSSTIPNTPKTSQPETVSHKADRQVLQNHTNKVNEQGMKQTSVEHKISKQEGVRTDAGQIPKLPRD